MLQDYGYLGYNILHYEYHDGYYLNRENKFMLKINSVL